MAHVKGCHTDLMNKCPFELTVDCCDPACMKWEGRQQVIGYRDNMEESKIYLSAFFSLSVKTLHLG